MTKLSMISLITCLIYFSIYPQQELTLSAQKLALENKNVELINYAAELHKEAVMKIAFQDPLLFFTGSHLVQSGLMSLDMFEAESRKAMEVILQDPLRMTKILVRDGNIIGFVEFYKTKEKSLESIKQMVMSQGLPFNEDQFLQHMPHIKRTDAECEEFAEIECVAISKECRGNGYSKILIDRTLHTIQQLWPTIKNIRLNVNEDNEIARKLYESQGFSISKVQPHFLLAMKALEYTKDL